MQDGCSWILEVTSSSHLDGWGGVLSTAGAEGLPAAVSSGLGTVLKGSFPELSGCSQLGGGWSSPLQRGLARFTRGPRAGSGRLLLAGPQMRLQRSF